MIDDNHVITAGIQTMANPDDPAMNGYELKVTLMRSERGALDEKDKKYVIYSALWNNSDKKMDILIKNNYIINLAKEQHTGGYANDIMEAKIIASIQRGAHIIRADGFWDNMAGNLSPGYIYGVEIEDDTNHKCYDIQFELGKDWKWRYHNIEIVNTRW